MPSPVPSSPGTAKKRVLVIDDEPLLRHFICHSLQLAGYETTDTGDPFEGLSQAKQSSPDLVICDVLMERLDGYATLKALRSEPETRNVPVILMTGKADNEGFRRGMKLGADDYLPKPFTPDELTATVGARFKKSDDLRAMADGRLADLRARIRLVLPHELLTPLNGILGFSELLSSEGMVFEQGEIKEMAGTIHSSAARLHRLIINHLALAQIEMIGSDPQGVKELREARCADVAGTVGDCAKELARVAGRLPDLSVQVSEGVLQISAEYLRKIVVEIIENAFKFSSNHTGVQVIGENAGELYRIAISDKGRGMSARQIEEIGAFMQFGREQQEQQGIGLGLALSRKLVELHAGSLHIRSTPDHGTTVQIELPRMVPKELQAAAAQAEASQ